MGSNAASPRNRLKRKPSLLLAALAAVLVLFLLIAGGGNLLAAGEGKSGDGQSLAAKSLALLRDPLSVFGDRSPGERAAGALFNTKPDRVKPDHDSPAHERVLSAIRDRPLVDLPALDLPPPTPPMLPDEAILGPGLGLPGDPLFEPMVPGTPYPPMIIPPFPTGPGGGGGIFPPPDGGGGAGVPEPSTWAMMILGIFAAGAAMRLGRRRGSHPTEETSASASC